MIKRMGKFDWCAVIEKQWCNLWKRQNVLSLQGIKNLFAKHFSGGTSMGITRLHNFEHRNKAYFKVFKVKYVKLFVLGKSHEQMFFCFVD